MNKIEEEASCAYFIRQIFFLRAFNPRYSRKKVQLFTAKANKKYMETGRRDHRIELISPRFSNTFEFSSQYFPKDRATPPYKTTLQTISSISKEKGIEKSRGLNSAPPPPPFVRIRNARPFSPPEEKPPPSPGRASNSLRC